MFRWRLCSKIKRVHLPRSQYGDSGFGQQFTWSDLVYFDSYHCPSMNSLPIHEIMRNWRAKWTEIIPRNLKWHYKIIITKMNSNMLSSTFHGTGVVYFISLSEWLIGEASFPLLKKISNVVLVSAVQQCRSAIIVRMSPPSLASRPSPSPTCPGHHRALGWVPCVTQNFSPAIHFTLILHMFMLLSPFIPLSPSSSFPFKDGKNEVYSPRKENKAFEPKCKWYDHSHTMMCCVRMKKRLLNFHWTIKTFQFLPAASTISSSVLLPIWHQNF